MRSFVHAIARVVACGMGFFAILSGGWGVLTGWIITPAAFFGWVLFGLGVLMVEFSRGIADWVTDLFVPVTTNAQPGSTADAPQSSTARVDKLKKLLADTKQSLKTEVAAAKEALDQQQQQLTADLNKLAEVTKQVA